MICPIRPEYSVAGETGYIITSNDCIEEVCAWWNKKAKSCAIAEIAKNFDILAGQGGK